MHILFPTLHAGLCPPPAMTLAGWGGVASVPGARCPHLCLRDCRTRAAERMSGLGLPILAQLLLHRKHLLMPSGDAASLPAGPAHLRLALRQGAAGQVCGVGSPFWGSQETRERSPGCQWLCREMVVDQVSGRDGKGGVRRRKQAGCGGGGDGCGRSVLGSPRHQVMSLGLEGSSCLLDKSRARGKSEPEQET